MSEIRSYRPADRDALYDICVRTADAGGDARGHHPHDDLMGDLFAGSYAHLEPDLAFVLDDGHGRPVGYIVGTADTGAFVERYRAEWIPLIGDKYVEDGNEMVGLHFHPEHMLIPEMAAYPAHLHMNLLPPFQRQGHGRRLMHAFLAAANAAGAGQVHLGMLTVNGKARAFYERLGFTEVPVKDPGPITYLARATGERPE
jgi:GNAT superfamily N-acetyltransferase